MALATPDGLVTAPALSSSALVWILAHGPDVDSGGYATVELYKSPVPSKASEVVASKVADLPGHSDFNTLATGGDFAATVSYDGGVMGHLVVAQLSTGKVWSLPARTVSTLWWDVIAASSTDLLVSEADVHAHEPARLVHLVFSSLDIYAKNFGH